MGWVLANINSFYSSYVLLQSLYFLSIHTTVLGSILYCFGLTLINSVSILK